jgi:hypothetical protein
MNYNVINLFPVPIIQIKFDNHNEYQFPDIEKSVNKPKSWERPLNTTFPSIKDDDSFVPNITRDCLMIDITKCIKKTFKQLNLLTDIYLEDFWYNIYHDNQGQEIHDHIGSVFTINPFWSGIYYNKNSSPTTFIRPGKSYKMQTYEGCEESNLADAFMEIYKTKVEDGDIILFPPYLDHYIETENRHKDNMRLTFSFNIGVFKNVDEKSFKY